MSKLNAKVLALPCISNGMVLHRGGKNGFHIVCVKVGSQTTSCVE